MKKLIALALISIAFVVGCTDPDGATRVLQQNGYTQIEITGYKPWMGGDDTISTGFRARSPNGTFVTGAVTSDWGKGSTIRFD